MKEYMIGLTNGNFFKIKADTIIYDENRNNIVFRTKGIITATFYPENIAGWAEIFEIEEGE